MSETRDFEHKGLALKLKLAFPTQRQLEAYFAAVREYRVEDSGDTETRGTIVRAALKSGWIVEPAMPSEDVGDLSPAAVKWIAGHIGDLYDEATTIPPE